MLLKLFITVQISGSDVL